MDKRISVDSRKVSFSYNKGDETITSDDIIKNGNRMMCGNGLIGYRGTTDETTCEGMAATILNGVYDRQGNAWREPVNFPNGLFSALCVCENIDEEKIHSSPAFAILGDERLVSHTQSIDYKYGVFSRKTSWKHVDTNITVESERFVSMVNHNLLCAKYTVTSDRIINVTVCHGIDSKVYDINGPHFEKTLNVKRSLDGSVISVSGITQEKKIPFEVTHKCISPDRVLVKSPSSSDEKELTSEFITLTPNIPQTWYFFDTVVIDENSDHNDFSVTYQDNLEKHCKVWDEIWKSGDVVIEGDVQAQNELRYSLYQLQIIAPSEQNEERPLSVPARGLSGQTYKGAVFWDTEMFISPYFLFTRPEVVRNFIKYRILTLEGAKRKAAEYGFDGAFYAWESQETGDDACSDYNVTDVFTGRPQKTYFRDKQIHISGDIVYAISEYLDATDDFSILKDGAFEVILECAKFYLTACVFLPVKKRYELHDVIGPDEYHERVNNNAYTNRIAKQTFDTALKYISYLRENDADCLKSTYEKTGFAFYEELLGVVAQKLYVPSPNANGVIEQFDGYFDLEDCTLQDVRSRLLNDKEYWGGGNGVASQTRIIKQADTILMLNMFPDDYSNEIKKANFEFYEPRTEHGSSLSPCMYALTACKTGNSKWGYPFFRKTAGIDISGESKQFAGLIYIGGTHPAASGGAWISVIKGFCGFSIQNGKPTVNPALPENWEKVQFNVKVRAKEYQITITKEGTTICPL